MELKHFISNAHISDFVVLFASTGTDEQGRNLLSCFLVDLHQKELKSLRATTVFLIEDM